MKPKKKNPLRFTLQFNSNSPDDLRAAGLINQQGSKKSAYVVLAVLHYADQSPSVPSHISRDEIERIVRQILTEYGIHTPDTEQSKPSTVLSEDDTDFLAHCMGEFGTPKD